ncbi:LOW QUALITY PROTEIN: immortalization up-regulated protein [Hipposideros larvatus]
MILQANSMQRKEGVAIPISGFEPTAGAPLAALNLKYRGHFLRQSTQLLSAALESTSKKPKGAGQVSDPRHRGSNRRINHLKTGHILWEHGHSHGSSSDSDSSSSSSSSDVEAKPPSAGSGTQGSTPKKVKKPKVKKEKVKKKASH